MRKHGCPRRPEELTGHQLVQSRALGAGREWPYYDGDRTISVPVAPRLQINTNDAVIEAVSRGWGLSRLLSYQVARGARDGYLQTILADFEPPPLPIHIVHQEGRMVSAKLRAFVDFMAERLRADTSID